MPWNDKPQKMSSPKIKWSFADLEYNLLDNATEQKNPNYMQYQLATNELRALFSNPRAASKYRQLRHKFEKDNGLRTLDHLIPTEESFLA